MLSKVDLNKLEIFKGDWVDPDFNEDRSHIVYRTKWRDNPDSWLYFLFEHKSYVDKLVKKKLLFYTVDIIRQHENQNKTDKPSVVMSEVISIIIYHGNDPWNVPNSIKPMFAILEGTEEYVIDFKSVIVDLSKLNDDTFCEGAKSRALLLALKYSRTKDVFKKLLEILRLFNNRNTGYDTYLLEVLMYLINVIGKDRKNELDEIVIREHKQGKIIMETIADLMTKNVRE